MTYDIIMQQIRDEVTRLGAQELRTPSDVDAVLKNEKGTVLVVVNSTCGCAGGVARPALAKALQNKTLPSKVVTVFASGDREATAQARSYFENNPPSSPSFALLRDGKLLEMVHRYQIEGHTPDQVARTLTTMFDVHCDQEHIRS
ncbi:MAG TPA: BrxA/BrxB family bacilliredoxin [Bacteroidota bacterium]|nr:BrxA/BrxB family bacilliredoxin [Bacteroidota bacterium]